MGPVKPFEHPQCAAVVGDDLHNLVDEILHHRRHDAEEAEATRARTTQHGADSRCLRLTSSRRCDAGVCEVNYNGTQDSTRGVSWVFHSAASHTTHGTAARRAHFTRTPHCLHLRSSTRNLGAGRGRFDNRVPPVVSAAHTTHARPTNPSYRDRASSAERRTQRKLVSITPSRTESDTSVCHGAEPAAFSLAVRWCSRSRSTAARRSSCLT